MINIKKCSQYLIEKENCKNVRYDEKKDRYYYQNDEIELFIHNCDGNYSSIVINFLDEKLIDKKNSVRIIKNSSPAEQYIHVVFDYDGGYFNICFENDSEIIFDTLNGSHVSLTRINNRNFYWYENNPANRSTINLDEKSAQNVVDMIKEKIMGDNEMPKINRLFDIIRYILVLSVLEIDVYTVTKGLYRTIPYLKNEIKEIDVKLAQEEINEKTRTSLENRKKELIDKINELEEIIDDAQSNIWDEYSSVNISRKRT